LTVLILFKNWLLSLSLLADISFNFYSCNIVAAVVGENHACFIAAEIVNRPAGFLLRSFYTRSIAIGNVPPLPTNPT